MAYGNKKEHNNLLTYSTKFECSLTCKQYPELAFQALVEDVEL